MKAREVPYRPGFPKDCEPGDYMWVPSGADPRPDCLLYLVDPTGGVGAILESLHAVNRGINGLTVTPSIVMPSGWHGFLTDGELA